MKSYTQVRARYQEAVSDALGTTDSESTLADLVTGMQTAFANLAVTPESDSLKYLAVEAAATLADSLSALSDEVQQQRTDADRQIETAVGELNAALEEIDRLNEEIVKAKALGQETEYLEDARRMALATVSEKLDVSYFTTGTGELHVYTQSGQPLVGSSAHTLSYDAAGAVSAAMTYPGGFDGILLDGDDVTALLSGGEIGALVEVRDEVLPAIQAELDALAVSVIETVNTVSNQGTANPAAKTLTGTATVDPADTLTATGTLRIALLDSDGTVDTLADLDLTTYATNQDLANAINAIAGISASFDAEGHLVITSDDASLGVALNEMDSAVGTDGVGASYFFGLNDVFTGSSAADISVSSMLTADSTLLAVAELSDDAALAAGDSGVAPGDGSIAEELDAVLSGTTDIPAAGGLSATKCSLAEYASSVIQDVATRASVAATEAATAELVAENLATSFLNESGVNIDEETAFSRRIGKPVRGLLANPPDHRRDVRGSARCRRHMNGEDDR